MKLNEIKDNPGSSKARIRVGRGIGSGKGKQAGRGGKGQTARSGVRIKGFEGGQMPLHRRLPKRGFTPPNRLVYNEVNLGRIQSAIDAGKLDAAETITVESAAQGRRRHPSARRGEDSRLGRTQGEGEFRSRRRVEERRRRDREGRRQPQDAPGRGRAAARRAMNGDGVGDGAAADHMIGAFPPRRFRRGGEATCFVNSRALCQGAPTGERHGVGRRTARSQYQLVGLRQGGRTQEAHLVHARRARHLPPRDLHPAARHRFRRVPGRVPRAEAGRARHVQHVLGRRRAAHGGVRAEHHALHLGLDHHPAPELGGALARGDQERGRAGPQGPEPVHPLSDRRAGDVPGLRHRDRARGTRRRRQRSGHSCSASRRS